MKIKSNFRVGRFFSGRAGTLTDFFLLGLMTNFFFVFLFSFFVGGGGEGVTGKGWM